MKTNILKIVKKMFFISVEPDNIYHFLGEPKKKKISVKFAYSKIKFSFSLHYDGDNSYQYVKKQTHEFNAFDIIPTIFTQKFI